MLELALAKLTALGLAGKTAVGLATAASVVAVGGAAGVVPVLPPQAADAPAEQTVVTSAAVEDEDADVEDVEDGDVDDDAPEDASDDAPEEGTDEGAPAPEASFGQSVAERAQDGGVDGSVVSAEARQRAEERRAARELPEQATAGQARGAENRSAGQATAAEKRSAGQEASTDSRTAGQDQAAVDGQARGEASTSGAERSADRGEAGRTTAGNAPVNETAPAGTPAEERAGGRR